MAASYPAAPKSFAALNAGDTIQDTDIEQTYDEVTAMQQALLTDGLEHNIFPQSTADARTLGTSSQYWGQSYLKALSLLDASELTVASGAVVVTQGYHKIDTEGDAASDDLATLTATGLTAGFLVLLRAENITRVVTVKNGTGNLLLSGDFVMNATNRTITLIFDGTNWREVARSVSGVTAIESWTPVLGGVTSESGQAYATQVGRAIKNGSLVHVQGYVKLSTEGTITGGAVIKGLPYPCLNVANAYASGVIGFFEGLAVNYAALQLLPTPNTSYMAVYGQVSAAAASVALAAADIGNGTGLIFQASYLTDP